MPLSVVLLAFERCECLAGVSTKIQVLRDVTPSLLVNGYGRFGGSSCLHLKDLAVPLGVTSQNFALHLIYSRSLTPSFRVGNSAHVIAIGYCLSVGRIIGSDVTASGTKTPTVWMSVERCIFVVGHVQMARVATLAPVFIHWRYLAAQNAGMRRITTFRSTTDRISDGGPIIL